MYEVRRCRGTIWGRFKGIKPWIPPNPKSYFLSFVLCSNTDDWLFTGPSFLFYIPSSTANPSFIPSWLLFQVLCHVSVIWETQNWHSWSDEAGHRYCFAHQLMRLYLFFGALKSLLSEGALTLEMHARRNKIPFLNVPYALPAHLS